MSQAWPSARMARLLRPSHLPTSLRLRNPELVALAKRLHRHKPKGGRMSLRAISAELAARGFLNENGHPFAAASIKAMLSHKENCRHFRPSLKGVARCRG